MQTVAAVFLFKAGESLAGAESEYVNGRYNNCANRCYYACFQAAIAALIAQGIHPHGKTPWKHEFVQGQFIGELINRRKQYPPALKDVFTRTQLFRERADYKHDIVTHEQAQRLLRKARLFVAIVQKGGGEL